MRPWWFEVEANAASAAEGAILIRINPEVRINLISACCVSLLRALLIPVMTNA